MLFLLALVIARHIPFPSSNGRYPDIEPFTSALAREGRELEEGMKRLERLMAGETPAQENLIIMVNDSLELIQAVSHYNSEFLFLISEGKIISSFRSASMENLVQNLQFEKARIESRLDRIESLAPLISNPEAFDAMNSARSATQSILRAMEGAADALRRY